MTSITLKLIKQFQNYTPASPYDWPAHCQEAPRPPQADDPWQSTEELKQLFGKGKGKARREELHSHRPFGHKTHSLESCIQQKIKKNQHLRERYTSHH